MKNLVSISFAAIIVGNLLGACSQSPEARPTIKKKSSTSNDADQTNGTTSGTTNSSTGSDSPTSGGSTDSGETNSGDSTPTGSGGAPTDTSPPEVETPSTVSLAGGIDSTNSFVRTGEITGWAVDKSNLKNFLDVKIYFDGDNASGTLIGSTKANLVGADDNNGGEHAFIFQVPESKIDSKSHKVYAYAVVDGKEVALSSSSPYSLAFYKPKGGTAETIYKSIGFETKCTQCHRGSFTYENRWSKLVEDGFSGKAWSETNNFLYEKVSSSHRSISGGSVCSVMDCDKIKEWWKAEFGQ